MLLFLIISTPYSSNSVNFFYISKSSTLLFSNNLYNCEIPAFLLFFYKVEIDSKIYSSKLVFISN